jgi:hypothetical protein
MATGPGLDAVLVEVGHDQQRFLDSYFSRSPENAAVLLAQPRTLRESGAGARAYLELYPRIWALNEKLGADRRIKVVAADLDDWPSQRARSLAERTRLYAERGQTMVANLEQEVLNTSPRSRVLVFMSGLQALKRGTGQLQTGGTTPVRAQWFAAHLESKFPGEVHSVIVDATGTSHPDDLVSYLGTRLPGEAESVLPAGRYALRVNEAFDFLSRPIRAITGPGLLFDIQPRQYKLKTVADQYIHLGN